MDSKDLSKEIQGIAQFTVINIFEIDPDNNGNRNYICTDGSRYIGIYKDQTGSITKDPSFKKILKAVMNQVCKRGNEIIDDFVDGYKIIDGAVVYPSPPLAITMLVIVPLPSSVIAPNEAALALPPKM